MLLFLAAGGLLACNPGLSGALKVYNDSHHSLVVSYVNYSTGDTIHKRIYMHESVTVHVLGGLGNKKTFDCCPC